MLRMTGRPRRLTAAATRRLSATATGNPRMGGLATRRHRRPRVSRPRGVATPCSRRLTAAARRLTARAARADRMRREARALAREWRTPARRDRVGWETLVAAAPDAGRLTAAALAGRHRAAADAEVGVVDLADDHNSFSSHSVCSHVCRTRQFAP
jgi:hypothetical protein